MSSAERSQPQPRAAQIPRTVRVINWPLRYGGWRAWSMLILLGIGASTAGWVARSGLMGGLCFAALALSAWRLWIPVTFEFRSKGILYSVLGRTRQIPWTRVARYEVRPRGLLLYADHVPHPLAALRSLFVAWRGERVAILEAVEFYMQNSVSPASTHTYVREGSSPSSE